MEQEREFRYTNMNIDDAISHIPVSVPNYCRFMHFAKATHEQLMYL